MEVDLFDPSAADGPRPAWRVIEAARRRYLTGQLVLETTPTTNVYLRDGQVYFAERVTDGGLAVRLLVEGVLTRAQMQKATLQVSGVEHLGRMFERDETIDRDAVELCIELMTDDVLTQIADVAVEGWTMKMYQRHPSGIDRWLPTRVEVITHLVDSAAAADPEATVTTTPPPARSKAQLTPPPVAVTGEVPVVAEPSEEASDEPARVTTQMDAVTADEVTAEAVAQHEHEHDTVSHHEALVAAADAAVEALGASADAEAGDSSPVTPPAPVVFAPIPAPFGAPVSTEVPAINGSHAPAPNADASDDSSTAASSDDTPIALAPSAMEALMSGSIKDEVAEAVRRALASIDT